MSKFSPLLAVQAEWEHVDFGNGTTRLVASRKLDGIRAIVIDGTVFSRKLKPIPNKHVQLRFGRPEFEGFDGELICGPANASNVYHATYSAVMSIDGDPPVVFHVFDHISHPDDEYHLRLKRLSQRPLPDHVQQVAQVGVRSKAELDSLEAMFLDEGYEGLMLRLLSGPGSAYKFGRATARSNTLLKVKQFQDAEAEVIGFEEEMFNGNEATTDALGHTKRSSHAENKTGKGRLGALVCKTAEGIEFKIGTGFDAATRQSIWDTHHKVLGKMVKYKSFAIGVKEAPRFPVFLGFRDPIDM